MCGEHRLGEDRDQLVTPDHMAFAIDCADPVPVAVEGDPEIEPLVGDQCFQMLEVFFDRRIGMMVGKGSVDLGEQQMMFAG